MDKTTEELREKWKDVMDNPAITNLTLDYSHGGHGWRKEQIQDLIEYRKHIDNLDLLAAHIVSTRLNLTGEEARDLTFEELMERYKRWPYDYKKQSKIPSGIVLGNLIYPILKEMWDELVEIQGCTDKYQVFFIRIYHVIQAYQKDYERDMKAASKEFDELLNRIHDEEMMSLDQLNQLFTG